MKITRGGSTENQVSLPGSYISIQNPLFKKEGEEFCISFFEGVLERNPYLIDCLKYLGNAYTAYGMFEKGLEIDERLSRLLPEDSEVVYNLACSQSLLSNIDDAISSLKKAIDLGYNDIDHFEKDRDLDNIRNDGRYKDLINMLKERYVKVAVPNC